ncbi:sugar 3,4-ketoisomerase [Streptosporangium sp. G11]|uniref:sugar 3,4-ketoisomerase n=1 Tax=Streptosporangium sp. G11 TaxID=3436926 RepID=UPI003EBFB10A
MNPRNTVDSGQAAGKIDRCRMVELPEHSDPRGLLTVVEGGKDVDFDIKRAYFIHHVPENVARGAHGHRRLRQLIIAMHGSFEVIVDDGFEKERFVLDHPSRGLYVVPMIWRDMVNFTPDAVGLWLVSEPYDESEYYRDYAEFLRDARASR